MAGRNFYVDVRLAGCQYQIIETEMDEMSKREQQVKEIKAELSLPGLTKARRLDLKGMLKHSLHLLQQEVN